MAHISPKDYKLDFATFQRGARQEFHLSPLLCAIAMKPLAIAIHSNPDISDNFCGTREHTLCR